MKINQQPDLPRTPLPIFIIGSGGIVKDAHLPAYTLAGFPVLGLYDINNEKAQALGKQFPVIERVYESLDQMITDATLQNAIFDLAIPAAGILDIIKKIPNGSAVLIQKPMGNTLEEARQIAKICEDKNLKAAINFQLRYAPYMLAARQLIDQHLLGKIHDMEIDVCVFTPWHLWDFLYKVPRMEILYHSIHYLDLIRSFLGMPDKIYASTVKHPHMPKLASVKTSMILDYHEFLQARIITNHGHEFGPKHQTSTFKIEGTKGAIKITIGLSLNYPTGSPSKFEYYLLDKHDDWQEIQLHGDWFPHAFIGTMAGLQNHVLESKPLLHDVKSGFETMRLVEAAYQSNDRGGIKIQEII